MMPGNTKGNKSPNPKVGLKEAVKEQIKRLDRGAKKLEDVGRDIKSS